MRIHARSEKRPTVLRRIREETIGSRVFPFRTPTPTPASMPTVGTRRSTRVFVPKQQQRRSISGDGDPARVLRSGKRFAISTDDGREWLKVFGGVDGDEVDLDRLKTKANNVRKRLEKERHEIEKGIEAEKSFGIVYSRKRRRTTSNDDKNHKFGIVFQRKHRRKEQKVRTVVERVTEEPQTDWVFRGFGVDECSRVFAEKFGILDNDLWRGVECGQVVLAVLVDSSVVFSSNRLGHFLILVMNWMRRARVEVSDLVAFLFGRSICSVFSQNGIHFVPIQHQENSILYRNSPAGCGFCKIYGAREFVPLLSVDYPALPSYFKLLHAVIIVRSHYLPRVLRSEQLAHVIENSLVVYVDDSPLEMRVSGTEFTVSETPAVKMVELPALEDSFVPGSPKSVITNGSPIRRHQRKRSSLKNHRTYSLSSTRLRFGSFGASQNSSFISSTAKRDFAVSPVSVKPIDSSLSDLYSAQEESDVASSPGSCSKLRKSGGTNICVEKMKDLKHALAEVRQNIDSACCNVNILVADAEKGWREDGARVVLEMSESQEWYLAVKRGNVTRFLYKPQDLKLCSVNKFTHAYIWSGGGEDGWKLEFCDKWNWHVFKELHMECRNRNFQDAYVKVIPIPGVREVSGYEDVAVPSFTRPDVYLEVIEDEVDRALASEIPYYDMDSADEEWLLNLNSNLSDALGDYSSYISDEKFETIIFALEKDAYRRRNDPSEKERAVDLFQSLGTRDVVSAIYDYWLQKRKQKRAPLARVFQGPPLRRTPVIHKPFFRKKRSFKRQRSQAERNQAEWNQAGRGKPDLFLQGLRVSFRKRTQKRKFQE
ncbi:uncharacterized protein A4U43_C10F1660 [Asparagus officinalis]|uniref:Enhancer of polycomb-like protein n=1 Tax=Asparagus officinalis TaxID=4686 RepID=A0A5P1E328_ASPOF|nr:uncharacterized protein LOC109824912 isoform X2 [Asparagus officinalis]ONK55855.1 uncharacterized protein A4U43_C10F1660 [Asparagus officinalis]